MKAAEATETGTLNHAAAAPRIPQPAVVTDERRIVFVNRYFYPDLSATSQMLTDLVSALGSKRHVRHVICSRQCYDDASAQLPLNERWREVHIHRCWSTRFGRDRLLGRAIDYLSFYLSATLMMARYARRNDILVAMTDPPLISVCAALIAKLRGARLVNWLQDVFPEIATSVGGRVPAWLMRCTRPMRNWSLQAAHANVVLGFRMRHVIRRCGVSSRRLHVISNWADGVALTPRPSRWSHLRRALSAEQQFVVQYSGNLGRAHEYHTMLGAAIELRHEPGWLFLFVGGGANMRRLQARAAQAGLENMRFLPYQARESLADSLSAADVHLTCLLPSMEGLVLPSKLYGILAAGRPVIVIGDPDGEQARVVRAEDCGAAVRSGDSAGLVDTLRRLRGDPRWLQAAGPRARAAFERRYTFPKALEKWQRVLEAIH